MTKQDHIPVPSANESRLDIPDIEKEIKNTELEIKILELARLQHPRVEWSASLPIFSAFVATLISVISVIIVAQKNGESQLAVERSKAQITLIVESVKTGINNPNAALKNLQFFAKAGLLSEPVKDLVEKGESPVLPGATAEPRDTIFQNVDSDQAHLHPLTRNKINAILHELKSEGIPITLYEGFREPAHQYALYLRGRVTRGPVGTDTRPWMSLRQYGFAVTFGVREDGRWRWKSEDPREQQWWTRLRELAQKHGMELIATDPAAFKVSGIKIEDLHRGIYPPGDQGWAEHLRDTISDWIENPPAPPPPALNRDQ